MTIASEEAARKWLITALSVGSVAMDRLEQLVALLIAENEKQNLVAKGTIPYIWQRHIADSAQLLAVPRETVPTGLWLDLGTGAGFPGIVIAALQPDRDIVVVDSRRLRTEWLQRAADTLGLANVRVVHSRVEDLPLVQADVISARAFAPLEKLLELSACFSTPETLWVLPKGASAQHELAMLSDKWKHMFHVEQSLTDPSAGIVSGHLLGWDEQTSNSQRQGRRK